MRFFEVEFDKVRVKMAIFYKFIGKMREEFFGAIVYDRHMQFQFVNKKAASIFKALKKGAHSYEWLKKNCETENIPLDLILMWGIEKGVLSIEQGNEEERTSEKIVFPPEPKTFENRFKYPYVASVYPVYECNQKCFFCFSDDSHAEREKLSKDEWGKTLRQLVKNGVTQLVILGGEPFVVPELAFYMIECVSEYIPVTLFTNGTVHGGLKSEWIYKINNYDNLDIVVSIHGGTAKTHDKIVGVDGAYEICLASIKQLLANTRNRICVNMVVTKENYMEIDLLAEQLEKLGVHEFSFTPFAPWRGEEDFKKYMVDPEVIFECFHSLKKKEMNIDLACGILAAKEISCESQVEVLEMINRPCKGDGTIHIDPYGDIYQCSHVVGDKTLSLGNVKTVDIESVWSIPWIYERSYKWNGNDICRKCNRREECFGECPMFAERFSGNRDFGSLNCKKIYDFYLQQKGVNNL